MNEKKEGGNQIEQLYALVDVEEEEEEEEEGEDEVVDVGLVSNLGELS
jgi:hypothetical protein